MAALKDRLKADLTTAIRNKDDVRKATIRMALSAIGVAEVAGKEVRELTDDDVIAVLTREAKRRREAAEAFREGGRTDSAEREEAEAAVIAEYLPAPLSDAELDEIINAAVAETGAESPRDMGKVMKIVQPKVAGRAEGSKVAAAVKARLAP
jgi:uncharacterized protein YqeY